MTTLQKALIGLGAVVVVGGIIGASVLSKPKEKGEEVYMAKAAVKDLVSFVSATGRIEAVHHLAGEGEHTRAGNVATAAVGSGESLLDKRLQDAVHGRFGQAGHIGQIGDPFMVGQRLEHRQRLLDGVSSAPIGRHKPSLAPGHPQSSGS